MRSRPVLIVLMTVLIAGLATGCGAAPAAPAGGTPVDSIFGTVTAPATPQRVVALGWGDAEAALALGVQPVGASDWLAFGGAGVGPWATSRYTTPPQLLGGKDVSIEAVAALRPDLILWTRSTNDETLYRKLAAIAPTVAAPPGVTTAYGTTWSQQAEQVAAALGRKPAGAELVAGTEQRFARIRSAHPQWQGRTVAVGVFNVDKFSAYVPGTLRADILQSMGFVIAPTITRQNAVNFAVDLGTENVGMLDADLTVLFLIGADAAAARANPVLQSLGSTRAGRLVVLDDPSISKAISAGTVLGLQHAQDAFVPLLVKALGS